MGVGEGRGNAGGVWLLAGEGEGEGRHGGMAMARPCMPFSHYCPKLKVPVPFHPHP